MFKSSTSPMCRIYTLLRDGTRVLVRSVEYIVTSCDGVHLLYPEAGQHRLTGQCGPDPVRRPQLMLDVGFLLFPASLKTRIPHDKCLLVSI